MARKLLENKNDEAGTHKRARIMIMMQSAWTPKVYHKSQHPEWAAVRNITSRNPQCTFILVGTGPKYEHFKEAGILFYNLGKGDKIRYLLSLYMKFMLPLLLRPSVVVVLGGGISLVFAGVACILTRSKLICTVIGEIRYSLKIFPRKIRRVWSFVLKAAFLKSHVVLAISQSVKNEIRDDYKISSDKIFLYKYKISEIFNPNVSRELKVFFNPKGPIVMTVCRISSQKGLQYLVEASRTVLKRIPSVKFVIRAYSSEEKYERYVRNLIRKYNLEKYFEILIEYSAYEEIPKYMVAADVFVLPSVSEGLGVVVLEAMACGIPVIGSNVGGIPDMIKQGYNGLLVEPGDAQSLSEAITDILLNNTLRKRLSTGALSTVQRVKENEFEKLLEKSIFS